MAEVASDDQAWLQRVQGVVEASDGECRTVDIVAQLPWGQPGTGTDGLDLTAFREFLKAHPRRFTLRGNVVKVASEGASAARAAQQEFDEALWLHRVEAVVEGFGGQCTTLDLADKLLWGAPGTGTAGRGLREFLHAHGDRFGLQASSVWSRYSIRRFGAPCSSDEFDEALWLERVKQAVALQASSSTGRCTLQDLYGALAWGAPRTCTHGRSLRGFVMAHHQQLSLEGYVVSLHVAEGAAAEGLDDKTSRGLPRPGRVYRSYLAPSELDRDQETPVDGSADRLEAAIARLGGVCSTTDLQDLLLWGVPGSATADRSLRAFLRASGGRFRIDGDLVHLASSDPEDCDEAAARLAEAVVRSYGGTCIVCDIYRRLQWGRTPSTQCVSKPHLGAFLASQGSRFRLGGAPTPGSASGRSSLSVSLGRSEAFEEGLWLLCLEAAVRSSGGRCATRALFELTGWGRPGSGSHGRALRQFLAGHGERFRLDGFSVSLHAAAGDEGDGPNGSTWLRHVDDAIAAFGGGRKLSDLEREPEWDATSTLRQADGPRDFLKAYRRHYRLKGGWSSGSAPAAVADRHQADGEPAVEGGFPPDHASP